MITIIGMKAEPRSEIYFKFLNGRVQLLFLKDTQVTVHAKNEGSGEEWQPSNFKEIGAGLNQYVAFFASQSLSGRSTMPF